MNKVGIEKMVPGNLSTLTECRAPCPSCADHLGCWYKSGDAAEPK